MAAKPITCQLVDSVGNPYSGAKLYVYDAGGTTPRAIYTESTLSTASANPAIADSNGVVVVWVNDAAGDIKVVATNSAGSVTPHSEDNIPINALTMYPVFTFQGDQTLNTTSSPTFASLALTGNLTVAGTGAFTGQVTVPATPSASTSAASKGYVDGLADTIADINAITQADGVFIVSGGTNWVGESGATARASLGLDTLANFNTALTDATFASLAGTETLTNKTINLSSNTLTGTTAQFNTALSDGSFATLAGAETLTNKTINLSSNTVTGTTAQFNTALSDGSFATLAGTETLTNKTLTSPVLNGTLTGTALHFYTPEQYGCAGDDSTDDATNLQSAVTAATTAGKALLISQTHAIGSSISIPANAHIIFTESAHVRLTASGATQAFLVEGSNVYIENMRLKGPFPTEPVSLVSGTHYDTVATRTRGNNGIEVFKAIGTQIENLTLINPHVSGFGYASYWLEHLNNSRLIAPISDRVGKYGLIALSCTGLDIVAPNFDDHGPGQGGTGVLLNQYGIMFTRNAGDTLANAPVCKDCTVIGGKVNDVDSWEGLDTHGGDNIKFIGVTVTGVAFGGVATEADGASEKAPPSDVLFQGCHFTAGATVCSGAVIEGSDADNLANNVRYVDCVFDGFGGTANSVNRGAVDVQAAISPRFENCRWLNSSFANVDLNGNVIGLELTGFEFGKVSAIGDSAFHIRADVSTLQGVIHNGRADMGQPGNIFLRLSAASSPGYGLEVREHSIEFHHDETGYLIDHDPALAISSNFDVASANTVDVAIGGTEYNVAAGTWDTGISATFPAGKWGVALLSTDGTTPTRVVTWDTNSSAGYDTEAAAIANCPSVPADEAAVGFVTVQADAINSFTAGTDALTGGTGGNPAQTTTYYNDRFPLPAYRIYSAGEVGRQYAVGGAPIAFSAYYAASAGNVTGDATNYIMVYDAEYYDEGSVYNTSTGSFTAPVAGIYTFSVGYDVSGITGMNDLRTYLDVAGTVYDLFRHDPTNMLYNTNRITLSAAREVFVPKGGVVRVRTAISGGAKVADVIGSTTIPSNYFSGRLIRPAVNE